MMDSVRLAHRMHAAEGAAASALELHQQLVAAAGGATEAEAATGGSWLCALGADCRAENLYLLLVLFGLIAAIGASLTMFFFFREDKEEQITPLCPQLVVHEQEIGLRLPLKEESNLVEVVDSSGKVHSRLLMDWPDPFRAESRGGVVATVRLLSDTGVTLATVVASMGTQGLGLALYRGNSEIFGFVKAEPPRRYHVRHRTGVHLLTLVGDFSVLDFDGTNPVGSRVCSFKTVDGDCHGRVLQHVDAGLIMCSLMATYVHRRLTFAIANATGHWSWPREGPSPQSPQSPQQLADEAAAKAADEKPRHVAGVAPATGDEESYQGPTKVILEAPLTPPGRTVTADAASLTPAGQPPVFMGPGGDRDDSTHAGLAAGGPAAAAAAADGEVCGDAATSPPTRFAADHSDSLVKDVPTGSEQPPKGETTPMQPSVAGQAAVDPAAAVPAADTAAEPAALQRSAA